MSKKIYIITSEVFNNTEWKGNRIGKGLVKVGETTRKDVSRRLKEQTGQLPVTLKLEKEFKAETMGGDLFDDHLVHAYMENVLKITRIDGVEWFECTVNEACEAVEDIINERVCIDTLKKRKKLPKTGKPWKRKELNYYKEEKKKVNAKVILGFIENGITSTREIAALLHEKLELKHIAPKTTENLVGEVIRRLINMGIIKSVGEKYKGKLKIIEKIEDLEKIEASGSEGKAVPKEKVMALIKESNFGMSLDELCEKLDTSKPVIHKHIKYFVNLGEINKVSVTRRDGFNGIRMRYFYKDKEVILPEGEFFKLIKKDEKYTKAQEVLKRLFNGEEIGRKEIWETFHLTLSGFSEKYASDTLEILTIGKDQYLVDKSSFNEYKYLKNISADALPYLTKSSIEDLYGCKDIEEIIFKILKVPCSVTMTTKRLINLLKSYYNKSDSTSLVEYLNAMIYLRKIEVKDSVVTLPKDDKYKLRPSIVIHKNKEKFLHFWYTELKVKGKQKVSSIARESGESASTVLARFRADARFIIYPNNKYLNGDTGAFVEAVI